MVVGKMERVEGIQPAMIGMAVGGGRAEREHGIRVGGHCAFRKRRRENFRIMEQSDGTSMICFACFGHAGDGNIHVNIMAAGYHTDRAVRIKVGAALDELFTQVLAWGGVITGEHGIGLAKERWWPQATTPVSRKVHAALKAALDPLGILNPGKFVATTM